MKYYPVFMDIKDKDCLVVGGGSVGMRKVAMLVKCGAKVKVISKQFSDKFADLQTGTIDYKKKNYEKKDIAGMFFVFAATDNYGVNQTIKDDAEKLNILCNIADSPDKSDFILPSIVERGDLVIAVSTSGSSPAMAKRVRIELEQLFGHEYDHFLTLMGNIRKNLLLSNNASADNKHIFHTLIDKGILRLIKENDEKTIDSILCDVLGKEYSYKKLVSKKIFFEGGNKNESSNS